ncbi:MAG: hypothetical protein VX938_05700, partial [Myxococcota bacterium]|nr:hypothetical protein [Myxococcota bacterium]
QRALNEARARLELPEIPVRWHNRFFVEDEFRTRTAAFFDGLAFDDFASTYYFATRVVYSAICNWEGAPPDYHHPIHQQGHKLPHMGSFSPVRLVSARRRSGAS